MELLEERDALEMEVREPEAELAVKTQYILFEGKKQYS